MNDNMTLAGCHATMLVDGEDIHDNALIRLHTSLQATHSLNAMRRE